MSDYREPSSSTLILHPLRDFDPRETMDGGALIEANRNAYPLVAANRPKRDSFGLLAGGGIAVTLGLLTFLSMSGHRAAPVSRPAAVAPLPPPSVAPAPSVALVPVTAQPAPGGLILPHTQPWGQIVPAPVAGAGERVRAPLMVYDSSGVPLPDTAGAGGSPLPAVPPGFGSAPRRSAAGGELTGDERFADRMGVGSEQVAVAEQLSNPASTVAQGTLIGAVLETGINTDLPGYVRALVSRDVRSFDGSQVLIPRSSRLIGQYKSGLAAGQTRAYVIWTRLIRPDGVSVALDSPAVDDAGTAGLAGKVNSHFMKRFGSALLLSVIGGLSTMGSGGASVIVGGGGQSAASVAAGQNGSIAPTIRVAQGEPIRIFTAKDLDFSSVPRLVAAR
ncbi:TrbI/VirB10 family protein [Sphingomonas ginkgonis]|uniref:TrbI/VirB10 family protein n=1 Tax=Sphingomonas ginkgonis TaxID=2315330 RepID=A0A429VBX7_9SPHN|nr:TrbI/VirB10 family protein [Sphingomonas ginkgonis]RST31499.1 TrbI/VirB10 family protein [Sphingomonas ginkgonis]